MALSVVRERVCSNIETSILKYSKDVKWLILMSLMQILVINLNCIIAMDVRPKINKYCRDKDNLTATSDIDEYLLIDGELNETIVLECKFCYEKYDNQSKFWYWQDRNQFTEEREVDVGMYNNISLSRIHITLEFSLVIRNLNLNDSGIYRCHGKEGEEADKKFNYRIEPVYGDDSNETVQIGNLSDWQKYNEINLVPVTMSFAQVSNMSDISLIRNSGITLELVSEWGRWSPCKRCKFGKGYKTRRAHCRIKREINETLAEGHNTTVINFFRKSPLLPCRSIILENYPGIFSATRYLPEFDLEERCKKCKKVKKHLKFKYRKRYVLPEGARLEILCPESGIETRVDWRKDGFLLEKGKGHSFKKKDPVPKVYVNTLSSLLLIGVTEDEGGIYTCYVDSMKMMKVRIVVVSKSRILNEAFLRHLVYLSFILLLSTVCYFAGLTIVCRRRDEFKFKNYKEIQTQKEEK